ncbi:zinc-ribbon domain-containing protein [Microbacterium gorillae]|uniref:zinc-ribbon domain-containing protein n=1 Tax=Microbacterium gorillae TaxID=1231063 RepID=UPI000B9C49F8
MGHQQRHHPRPGHAYSTRKVVWRCKRNGHIWKAPIGNRSNGRGCRQCRRMRTIAAESGP